MKPPAYTLTVNNQGLGSVNFVHKGRIVTMDSDHPGYKSVVHALIEGLDLDAALSIPAADKITQLSTKITLVNDVVHFKGEPVHSTVADAIVRYIREGRDSTNLVKFLESLERNPSKKARAQLFNWVVRQGLRIDVDGRILAHKGVNPTINDGEFVSIHSGTAYVDGTEFVKRQIPQRLNSIVTMPRREVDDNHEVDCSHGLHVGTFAYAVSFGTYTMVVAVEAENVVSVPDYDTNKMRVCKYQVVDTPKVTPQDLSYLEPDAENEYDPEDILQFLLDSGVPTSFVNCVADYL